MEIKEIREFRDYIINTRHSGRIKQQGIDQTFFDDTFAIPHINKTDPKKSQYEIRTGFVAEMANGFTEQLITPTPKVFTKPKLVNGKQSKEREESADRIASVGNKWSYILGKQSHNPFKQTFKYLAFTRGEAWIYIAFRSDLAQWEGDTSWQEEYPDVIPVEFLRYDPMIVFHEPTEDIDGQPSRVVVSYKRTSIDIHTAFPLWSKYNSQFPQEQFPFFLYVDKDTVYAEAGDEPILLDKNNKLSNSDGRRGNPLGVVPFVHSYSGWGIETQNKAPEYLAYSRVRMLRGRVEEDASMAADFSYNIHAFAFKHRTLLNQSGQELPLAIMKEYHPDEPGKLSILTLPSGADVKVEETQLFDAPVFAYRAQVKTDLAVAYPAPLRGIASGTSGRQEDILSGAGLAFYDCTVENNSSLWAQAFEKALKICYKLPDMIPSGLQKEDIDNYSEIVVDTKRDDPLEALRDKTDGDRKQQLKIISHETNLIKYQGFTKEEAELEMVRILVEDITYNHPVFREILAMKFAQEEGTTGEFAQISEQMGNKVPPISATPQFGSQGGQPREGNIQTPTGMEQVDMSLQRSPRRAPAGVQ